MKKMPLIFGLFPSGVAKANHLPPPHNLYLLLLHRITVSSFMTSVNLLFGLPLGLMPTSSNLNNV